MTTSRISLLLGILVSAAVLIARPVPAEEPATTRLTVLHTSDLHGAVMPFDDYANTPSRRGSLAQVATIVEAVRESVEHPVVLLDSGDTIQGSPLEQFAHVRWGEPSPTITAMNRIGYQAMAVGNHEFNFGLEVLERARNLADFPFLSANTISTETGEPAFRPYVVLEEGPVRVGVLGLTTPNVPGWEKAENYAGLEFEPMDAAARRWVPVLRGREKCDIVIVIAHTGFERDLETGDPKGTHHEDFGWRLSETPGIDLLLTGHAHTDIPPCEVNGVIASQPQARARLVTRIDLELVEGAEGWEIVRWTGENLASSEAEPDRGLTSDFTLTHQRLATTLDGPAGEVGSLISVDRCRLEDCAAIDLLHHVQLEATGADLSLAALLNARTPELEPGPVSWRWIQAFYVYPNTLVAVKLTGAQVRDVLEHAARFYDGIRCPDEGGCTVLTDPSIPHYNVDNMAGVSYRIDPAQEEGSRIRDLRYQGLPIDLEQVFVVAVNSYRAAGGGLFPHLAEAEVVWRSSEEMADLIAAYLGTTRPWNPTVDGNWSIGRDLAAEKELPVSDSVAEATEE